MILTVWAYAFKDRKLVFSFLQTLTLSQGQGRTFLHRVMVEFFCTQGQRNPEVDCVVWPKSNSNEILLLFSLPASMKKIQSKQKGQGLSHFSHHKSVKGKKKICHSKKISNPKDEIV